jgi:SAM-dependent methyltransferase
LRQVPDANDLVASGYEAFYASWGRSPTLRQIWRTYVTGPDFPEEFAHISFLQFAQLQRLGTELALHTDQLLVDVACGAGGPGLWAAREFGAFLVGVDLAVAATERAAERAEALGMGGRARFLQGTFEATGIESSTADAVMSVDALQYVPDKNKALAEVARILKRGGRFGLVAFELDPARVAGLGLWDDPIPDYRPILERVGFDVNEYEEIPGWAERVAYGFEAVLTHQDALRAELGDDASAAVVLEAAVTTDVRPYRGHVIAVSTRR